MSQQDGVVTVRFLATKTGMVHIDISSDCPASKRMIASKAWKGIRGLKPEEAMECKDCAKCDTHKTARSEIRANKLAAKSANVGRKHKPKVADTPALPAADVRTSAKAEEHAALAREHGWDVTIESNDKGGLTVIAKKGDHSCVLTYRGGGYLHNSGIVAKFPGRVIPLHNSGTWRRQVSLPEGKRPVSGWPLRPARTKERRDVTLNDVLDGSELIPINKSSLPFPIDAEDIEIIDAIKGHTLYWRNNMAAKVCSALVPGRTRLVRVSTSRTGRRIVSFPESSVTKDGEQFGAERSVAVEDMLRVK